MANYNDIFNNLEYYFVDNMKHYKLFKEGDTLYIPVENTKNVMNYLFNIIVIISLINIVSIFLIRKKLVILRHKMY